MRKKRDGAGRARTEADASVQGKRRRSSRARSGATSQPRLTGKRRRGAMLSAVTPETQIVATSLQLPEAAVGVTPAMSAETAIAAAAADRDPKTETASTGDQADASPDDTADAVRTPVIPAPDAFCAAEQPSAALEVASDIVRNPSRSHRARPAVMRWAAAAAILAGCLPGLGRLSDTQVSAYAVPASREAARPAALADAAPEAGLPPLREASLSPLQEVSPPPVQVAALVPPPAAVLPAAPADAEPAPRNVTAPIVPSAKERVPPRDKAPAARSAKLRRPVRTIGVPDAAAVPPPPEPAQTQLTGRAHAQGRYEMRWGTARLHEDPNSDRAEGPSWDFVASAGSR